MPNRKFLIGLVIGLSLLGAGFLGAWIHAKSLPAPTNLEALTEDEKRNLELAGWASPVVSEEMRLDLMGVRAELGQVDDLIGSAHAESLSWQQRAAAAEADVRRKVRHISRLTARVQQTVEVTEGEWGGMVFDDTPFADVEIVERIKMIRACKPKDIEVDYFCTIDTLGHAQGELAGGTCTGEAHSKAYNWRALLPETPAVITFEVPQLDPPPPPPRTLRNILAFDLGEGFWSAGYARRGKGRFTRHVAVAAGVVAFDGVELDGYRARRDYRAYGGLRILF